MDQVEFIKIIKENSGIIESMCRVYFPLQEDRQDCRQEILLELWKSWKNFRNECKPGTFIYRISLNVIFKKLRKEKRFQDLLSLDVISVHPLASSGSDDLVIQLDILMKSLKPMDKAIFILHLEGYSNPEITNILPISLTNVSTRLSRIRNILKLKIHDQSLIN